MERDLAERGLEGEQGFMLVGLIVAIFLILLALSVAAPKVAQDLRREREVEAVHRGNQYVRAIRLYYRKTGMYPASIEALEKTNNVRYLRQRYLDPMTGKDDWRLIKVGEAKTTVKGFFGQPLAGLTPGLGSVANQVSAGQGGAGTAGGGQQSSTQSGSSPGGFGSPSPGGYSGTPTLGGGSSSGPPTLGGGDSSSTPTLGAGSSSTPGSTIGAAGQQSGSGMSGGAPFVGVGMPKEGDSITILNEQTTYKTWEFIYDPRIEQLYAKGALFGGVPSGGLGPGNGGNTSAPGGTSSPFGGTSMPGYGSPGTTTPSPSSPTTPTTTPPQ